jgi:hypothetical protein
MHAVYIRIHILVSVRWIAPVLVHYYNNSENINIQSLFKHYDIYHILNQLYI